MFLHKESLLYWRGPCHREPLNALVRYDELGRMAPSILYEDLIGKDKWKCWYWAETETKERGRRMELNKVQIIYDLCLEISLSFIFRDWDRIPLYLWKGKSLKEQKRSEEENNNKRNMIYELLKIIKNVKFMIYIFMFLIIFLFPTFSFSFFWLNLSYCCAPSLLLLCCLSACWYGVFFFVVLRPAYLKDGWEFGTSCLAPRRI